MIKLFTHTCRLLLVCWLALGTVTAAFCQEQPSYYVQHFTIENGLPQNSVKSIAQCANGFIWLTTEGGLVRFDGRNFKVYTGREIAVGSNRMRYFIRGLKSGGLYALTEDYRLILIAGTKLTLLSKYYKRSSSFLLPYGKPVRAYRAPALPDVFAVGIPKEAAYQLPLDAGRTFLVDPDTVRFYDRKREQWKLSFPNQGHRHFFTFGGQLYYLDKSNSVTRIRHDTLQTIPLEGDILNNPAYAAKKFPKLYWNTASGDVFLYLDQCFYLLEENPGGRLNTRLLLSGFDFKQNNIYSAHYDKKNERLFLGSRIKGLFVVNRKPFRTLRFSKAENDEENYYAQTPYRANKVLTYKGNILGLEGFRRRLPLVAAHSNGHSMLTDSMGTIWTNNKQSVYQFSPDGRRLIREVALPGWITQLYLGQKGRIWIGTESKGLYYLDPGEKQARRWLSTEKDVTYIMQGAENTLWVGTLSGLYRLSLAEMKVDTLAGLGSTYIRSIYISRPGELWLTTAENGLFLYKDDKLTQLPLDKRGYLASSHCILEDKRGYFWITTNQGLFQIDKNNLLDFANQKTADVFYVYYGKNAGFNTNEFNGGCQPCGISLENGYFSFPSLDGLVWFKPGEIRPELPLNGIFIDEIEIDSVVVAAKDTLKLDAHFNRMRIYFTSPYFGNPYNLSFKYRLEGPSSSGDWLELKQDNMIPFSSLQSGSYQLTIRKHSGFGISGYSERQLVIIIPPYFYETWWFKALVLLTAVLLVLAYIRYRLKSVKRRNDELEKRIAERTLKLKQTIFEQQASREKLRRQNYLQQRLLAAITHDIKSPLQYLVLATKTIYEQFPPGIENVKGDLGKIYQSSSRVFYFTENLVQYMKVRMADSNLSNTEVSIFDLVSEKIEIFDEIAESKGNRVENCMGRDISIRTNEQLLGIVIHNLLDNALKFTRSGHIRFSSCEAGNSLKIVLEDTGKGMDPELISWCNTFALKRNGQASTAVHQGLGLTIVLELLAMIDGTLHVTNTAPGTRIEITL